MATIPHAAWRTVHPVEPPGGKALFRTKPRQQQPRPPPVQHVPNNTPTPQPLGGKPRAIGLILPCAWPCRVPPPKRYLSPPPWLNDVRRFPDISPSRAIERVTQPRSCGAFTVACRPFRRPGRSSVHPPRRIACPALYITQILPLTCGRCDGHRPLLYTQLRPQTS
jgi:hypothetical protein